MKSMTSSSSISGLYIHIQLQIPFSKPQQAQEKKDLSLLIFFLFSDHKKHFYKNTPIQHKTLVWLTVGEIIVSEIPLRALQIKPIKQYMKKSLLFKMDILLIK